VVLSARVLFWVGCIITITDKRRSGWDKTVHRREMRPVPDRIAELPEPFEGGVFDHGFVQAHGFGGLGFFGFGSFLKSFVA
jgi:hypothetical protein